jgi:hypothetical protein
LTLVVCDDDAAQPDCNGKRNVLIGGGRRGGLRGLERRIPPLDHIGASLSIDELYAGAFDLLGDD